MTIESRLAEIRARAEAATEGPWENDLPPGPGEDPMRPIFIYPKGDGGAIAYVQPLSTDAEFIAASRTDLPALLAAVEAVMGLHKPVEDYTGRSVCDECWGQTDYGEAVAVAHPCPTVQALTAALDADTTTREDQP